MNDANSKYFLPGAVLIGLLFIGGAVLYNGGHATTSDGTKPLSDIAKKVAADVVANKAAYDTQATADKTQIAEIKVTGAHYPSLSGTPAFLIGKQSVSGAYPYTDADPTHGDFKKAIDGALAGKAPITDGNGLGSSSINSKDIVVAGHPFIGKADAPMVIPFWSDFQCPYCKQFELNTLPQIITDYVDTGKVKIVFMDLAFLGQDSVVASEYGQALWKLYPEQYFAWRTAMYEAQDAEGDQGFGNAASIDQLNSATLK